MSLSDDPFVRWQLPDAAVQQRWSSSGALVVLTEGRFGPTLTGIGDTADVAVLAGRAAADRPDVLRVAVPRGTLPLLAPDLAGRVTDGADWDWFWTDAPPPVQPGEERVRRVDGGSPELAALLARFSPRASAAPGSPGVERWVGIVQDGVLVAVAANEPVVQGVPHLASVATVAEHRGRGLGGAVSGSLTRALLAEGAPVVTLGMYADNDVARRVYERLGFRVGAALSSRQLQPA